MKRKINLDLSVIIVNYKSEKYLESCIESIYNSTKGVLFEIIIIDNGSDKEIDKVIKNFNRVKLIKNRKNVGFSAAANQGIEKSVGKYILLLNPDTKILNNAVVKMKLKNKPAYSNKSHQPYKVPVKKFGNFIVCCKHSDFGSIGRVEKF